MVTTMEQKVSIRQEPLRLVMGMSRGGTTSVVRAMNLRGDVAAFGETCFWSLKHANPKSGVLTESDLEHLAEFYSGHWLVPIRDGEGSLDCSRDELLQHVSDTIRRIKAPATPIQVFRAYGEAVAEFMGKSFWVEKTPHHIRHLNAIIAAEPNARIVIMLRSPEGFLSSYKHQGDRKADGTRQNFQRLYHPLIASLICRGYLRAAAQAKAAYPQNVEIITLEEIRKDETAALARIVNHFQLPSDVPSFIPGSNSSFIESNARPPLTRAEKWWLATLAGNSAAAIGYEVPVGQFSVGATFGSLCSLVAWPFLNLRRFVSLKDTPVRYLVRWVK